MGNHGKRYSEEQIIAALKEAQSGISVNDICRKYGVSAASYYKWKAKYSGMSSTDLRRSRELELENRRLRKAVADLTLDIQVPKGCGNSKKLVRTQSEKVRLAYICKKALGTAFKEA